MSLFKKNKSNTLHMLLDAKAEEARNRNESSFYTPLLDGEYIEAVKWCTKHGAIVQLSHKNGNNLVYKFSEF